VGDGPDPALPRHLLHDLGLSDSWRTDEQHRALKQDAAQIKTDRALTGALIERLIDRIEVGEKTVIDGKNVRDIKIYYRFVGNI